jgi:hypothetical protein
MNNAPSQIPILQKYLQVKGLLLSGDQENETVTYLVWNPACIIPFLYFSHLICYGTFQGGKRQDDT